MPADKPARTRPAYKPLPAQVFADSLKGVERAEMLCMIQSLALHLSSVTVFIGKYPELQASSQELVSAALAYLEVAGRQDPRR